MKTALIQRRKCLTRKMTDQILTLDQIQCKIEIQVSFI